MTTMATTLFSHRIDAKLKSELEQIAKFEDRSASYLANQAIKTMVEERKVTRELIDIGLEMVEMEAPAIPSEDIHNWLLADDDAPYPEARSDS
jgi:predicted transcriptional regulator